MTRNHRRWLVMKKLLEGSISLNDAKREIERLKPPVCRWDSLAMSTATNVFTVTIAEQSTSLPTRTATI